MRAIKQSWLILVLALSIGCGVTNAETDSAKPQNELTQSPTNLLEAARQYKASTEGLLRMQESEVTKATAKLGELRELVAEGLIAKAELDHEEQSLAGLRAQLQTTQNQIADSDDIIAEIQAEQELEKARAAVPVKKVSKEYGAFTTTASVLRYNGFAAWSVGGLSRIQAFFSTKFGYSLPTSSVGQSATHVRLGYDHHNAVDVALHPNSSAGKALIKYLQAQGIPFLAFRAAVPGVATAPHIHIGNPSHKLA